jgi:hypothetical protein
MRYGELVVLSSENPVMLSSDDEICDLPDEREWTFSKP